MDEELKRDFKGIWIPKEIWLDTRLSPMEKCLIAEISSLDSGDGCYASNEYLANFFNSTERNIQYGISNLKKLGFIKQIGFNGRVRKLQVSYEKCCIADMKNISPLPGKNLHPSINNINIINSNNKVDNKVDILFAQFWNSYPKKIAKDKCIRWFNNPKNKVTEELVNTMVKAIDQFKQTDQWRENNGQFIPYPLTWLNAHRWEDEITLPTKQSYGNQPSYTELLKDTII